MYIWQIIKIRNMKTKIKTSSKNKSKYDNVYFDITINGHLFENVERSQVRHHIQILDEAIGV